ncbi:SRPBCC family protein [Actinocatenispora sera]|jgi:uncharacterized protein YndB with AHSA1/START domain|uniref:Polyketide cyclase/dehydrase/lipid transport protein n=1 Tax=Actinocatenispora sera TaxID=390989 RepID=A0A810L436_9ACTN|nr:SRPBCC family protein [Actinocatenispora sera]BCJ30320.1 hypothetical protein Asera_44280 [Actinocatenispora sera]
MWQHEYVAETPADPERVWQVLRDLDRWADWDTSMESVRLDGEFRVGSQVVMTPVGQDAITSTIVEISDGVAYADVTQFGGVTLRFRHSLEPLTSGGTRVRHRLEITGDAADTLGPELGPQITEDFPEAMAGLLARAER